MAREIPLARRAWDLLGRLEVDADTINVERHLPSQFQIGPPSVDADGFHADYSHDFGTDDHSIPVAPHRPFAIARSITASPAPADPQTIPRVLSPPQFTGSLQATNALRPERLRQDSTAYVSSIDQEQSHGTTYVQPSATSPTEITPQSQHEPARRRKSEPVIDKTKSSSRWRFPFGSAKRPPPTGVSGDSSSLSSTTIESQKLEEISLSGLFSGQKTSGRGKSSKTINAHLSSSSTLALFWTQLAIQVWNVGTSPPTMARSISTESTCILATVSKTYLAYVIGNRDQKLTVSIYMSPSTHSTRPCVTIVGL